MSQQSPSVPPSFEVPIRIQAIQQIREEIREQVRAEAWSAMRAKLRATIAGLGLVSLVVGALIGYYGGGRRAVPQSGIVTDPVWECVTSSSDTYAATLLAQPTPWPIRVYVSGAILEPRVVALPPGSLVADALDAVGGASADADLSQLNLAAPLRDHQHVQVPRLSARALPVTPAARDAEHEPNEVRGDLININTATPAELESLPGIGPTRAEEIIAFRETYGPFESVVDVMKVPGIGPATYERLAPLITVSAQISAETEVVPFP